MIVFDTRPLFRRKPRLVSVSVSVRGSSFDLAVNVLERDGYRWGKRPGLKRYTTTVQDDDGRVLVCWKQREAA